MGEHDRLAKRELRRLFIERRRGMRAGEMAARSRIVCAQVMRLAAFRSARHLVAYACQAGEVDPATLIEEGLARRMSIYFPRVVGLGLEFLAALPRDLRRGAYGVREPTSGAMLDPAARGVVFLVPGVAFDASGRRLGRGGGHYDRALARHPEGLRLGLTVDALITPELPDDPWDQSVDAVVTEHRLLWASPRIAVGIKETQQWKSLPSG